MINGELSDAALLLACVSDFALTTSPMEFYNRMAVNDPLELWGRVKSSVFWFEVKAAGR